MTVELLRQEIERLRAWAGRLRVLQYGDLDGYAFGGDPQVCENIATEMDLRADELERQYKDMNRWA